MNGLPNHVTIVQRVSMMLDVSRAKKSEKVRAERMFVLAGNKWQRAMPPVTVITRQAKDDDPEDTADRDQNTGKGRSVLIKHRYREEQKGK